MTKKQKVDLIIAIALVIIGSILFSLPYFGINNVRWIMTIVMGVYAILNFLQFVFTKESSDYEGLYTSIICLIVAICGYAFDLYSNIKDFVAIFLGWIIIMSLIKLKKSDYYNDRMNRMWIVRLFTLSLFVLTGLISSVNLNHSNNIQVLVLGFFFYIHGILELIDPLTNYMMGNK